MDLENGTDKELELDEIESYLESTLIQISPRSEFVNELKGRLINNQQRQYSVSRRVKIVLFTGAGLISSLLLIITGIRATANLVKMRRGLNKEQPNLI